MTSPNRSLIAAGKLSSGSSAVGGQRRFGPAWCLEKEMILIHFYETHPELWNSKNCGFHRTAENHIKLEKELKPLLGNHYTVHEIKRKFHNLRTQFVRIWKALPKLDADSMEISPEVAAKVPWRHFRHLRFLRSHNHHSYLAAADASSSSSEQDHDRKANLMKLEDAPAFDEHQSLPVTCEDLMEGQVDVYEQGSGAGESEMLESSGMDTADRHWLNMVEAELRLLDPVAKDLAKLEIQNVIVRAKHGLQIQGLAAVSNGGVGQD